MAQQVIRPTGLLDPVISVRPVEGQVVDLLGEINTRIARQERVLVTTLTKKMAEDLTDYLTEQGIKVKYMHHEVDTCAWAASTWWWVSTCCARVWTCRR